MEEELPLVTDKSYELVGKLLIVLGEDLGGTDNEFCAQVVISTCSMFVVNAINNLNLPSIEINKFVMDEVLSKITLLMIQNKLITQEQIEAGIMDAIAAEMQEKTTAELH